MKTAWALALLSVVATVAATTIAIANGEPVANTVVGVGTVFSLCFPVMGALVSRRGHHSAASRWRCSATTSATSASSSTAPWSLAG